MFRKGNETCRPDFGNLRTLPEGSTGPSQEESLRRGKIRLNRWQFHVGQVVTPVSLESGTT